MAVLSPKFDDLTIGHDFLFKKVKVSPTFCGVVDPPTLFVVIFAPTFFVVRYNTLCGQCYNTFYGFAITNFVVLPSSIYLNDK